MAAHGVGAGNDHTGRSPRATIGRSRADGTSFADGSTLEPWRTLGALAGVALIAVVHLHVGCLGGIGGAPRRRWLSAAGGASVAYGFVHLLPEIAGGQATLEASTPAGDPVVGSPAVVVAVWGRLYPRLAHDPIRWRPRRRRRPR